MSKRELRGLRLDSCVSERRLRSGKTRMAEGTAELQRQLRELQGKLEQAEEARARGSEELAAAHEREVQAQQKSEEERARAEELAKELHYVKLQAEVDKLRELDTLHRQFDTERERLRKDREEDAARFDEWRTGILQEKELEEQFWELRSEMSKSATPYGEDSGDRELTSTASTRDRPEESAESGHTSTEAGTHEPEGPPTAPSTSGDTGSSHDTEASVVPTGTGEGSELVQSVSRLLEAQTQMMAAHAHATAMQSFPPMPKFTGEDTQSDDDSFEKWVEHFEERAKLAGWTPDQQKYQLKMHLDKTAAQAYRMLPETEKKTYESLVTALKKRFHSVEIQELRGLEFHRLLQEEQSVEQLGIQLQSLARRAFPQSNPKEFDRLLKGRFFQALLPKWQRKVGAPKAEESFSDLYDRARTAEQHDKQFSATATARNEAKAKVMERAAPSAHSSHKHSRPEMTQGYQGTGHKHPPPRDGDRGALTRTRPLGSGSRGPVPRQGARACHQCGSLNHLARHCPQRQGNPETPGKSRADSASKSASSLAVQVALATESLTVQQLEEVLAKRKLEEEQQVLSDAAEVSTVTAETANAIGPTVYLKVTVQGQPVSAVVDSGSQATIISRALLHQIGKHLQGLGQPLPQLELPTVRLYGKGGKDKGKELSISAQTTLSISADGRTITVPVFIQPDSEVSCLLGMNAIPGLGVSIVRADGQPVQTRSVTSSSKSPQVRLVETVYVPSRKAMFLEAEVEVPFGGHGELIFEPDPVLMDSLGVESPEALLSVQSNGRVRVPVVNSSTVLTCLRKDTPLGCVAPVDQPPATPPEQSANVSEEDSDHGSYCYGVTEASQLNPEERIERLKSELHLGSGELPESQTGQLLSLISSYADVFALDGTELGHTDVVQHRIETGNHPPIKQPIRRMPFAHREKISQMMEDMEKQGIIQPSSSPWSRAQWYSYPRRTAARGFVSITGD